MKNKKEITKQNIIDSFWSLYEITRIEKITVKDICNIADINRSTFYQYFSDVYEVLETVENLLIPTRDTLPGFSDENNPVNFDVLSQIEFFKSNRKYLKVLLSENGNPAFRFKMLNSIRPMVLSLVGDKNKIENFDYILEYTLWGMLGVLSYHIEHGDDKDERAVLETIMKLSEKLIEL